MEKLKKPLLVRNINGTVNVEGAITYQVECNTLKDMWREQRWMYII